MSAEAIATEDGITEPDPPRKDTITMQSVAAYYVLVASELARESNAKARYDHPARKPSRLASLRNAFSRPVRHAASAA
jgi:hypothetical protein